MNAAELAALQRAMQELPPRCREALLLLRSGQSYAQAASQLGVNEPTARRLIERAMEYLLEQVTSVSAHSLCSLPVKTSERGKRV